MPSHTMDQCVEVEGKNRLRSFGRKVGWHGAKVVCTVVSQPEGSDFEPTGQLGSFCVGSPKEL